MRRTEMAWTLVAAAGLAASAGAVAQSGPLTEPFPDVVELADLLPPTGDGTLGFVLQGARESIYTGHVVAPAGDVNADGVQDFVIGTDQRRMGVALDGEAYIVFGRRSDTGTSFPPLVDLANPPAGWGVRVVGSREWPGMGRSVAGAGDVNGDGIDDVIIGATGLRSSEADGLGAAFVIFGRDAAGADPLPGVISPDDLDGTNGVRMEGWRFLDPSPHEFWFYSQAGMTVAGVGDINGDGADDVAIGARGGPTPSEKYVGTVCVVFGRPSAAGAAFGPRLQLSGLSGGNGFRIVGSGDAVSAIGRPVSAAGDVNGDGFDDMLVGDPGSMREPFCYTTYYCPEFPSGRAFVLFGRDGATEPFPSRMTLADIPGDNGFSMDSRTFDARVGTAVSAAGDVNGDGLDDILVGAPGTGVGRYYWDPSSDEGEAYVVFGRDDAGANPFGDHVDLAALDGTDGFTIAGTHPSGDLGFALAAAGDINSDGLNDFVVSQPRSRGGEMVAIYGRNDVSGGPFPARIESIYPGAAGGLESGESVFLRGQRDNDRAGASVGGKADFNGDGIDDLLIGAYVADSAGRTRAGEVYVVYGRNPPRPCRPDLDGDGALTIFDFLQFGNLFDLMDPRADFDGDGDFTIFDFLAFQNAFDAGCA